MRTSTRKTKASSNEELEAEYYTPQKVKLSEAKTSKKQGKESVNKENEDNNTERITIKLKGKSSKKVIFEKVEEEKEGQRMSSRCVTPIKTKTIEKQAPTIVEAPEFTEILESKYIPQSFLYREKEKADMFGFILNCIKKKKYDSLFISGNPGTGKTMTISYVLRKLEELGPECFRESLDENDLKGVEFPSKIKTFKFNAMNYKNPQDIVVDMMESFNFVTPSKKIKSATSTSTRLTIDKLKQGIFENTSDQLNVIFIDEIDNLFTRPGSAGDMLELLKIPKYPNSNIILIGASNTIDLIVKFNQEYKISAEIKNIVFEPYTYDEIFSILKDRIYNTHGLEDEGKAFEEMAVRFCAKKIYSLKGGDIRYVFEVVRKVYSQASHQEPVVSEDGTVVDSKITLNDMLKVFNELYGRNIDIIMNSMPQQQQIGLIALYLILTKKNAFLITKGDILSAYNNICIANFLPKIDMSTLEDILVEYESYEFVKIKTKKKATMSLGKSPHKMLGKNVNDEIIPVINADEIKSAFEQSDFFSRYFI